MKKQNVRKSVPVFRTYAQASAALIAGRVDVATVRGSSGAVIGTWAMRDGEPKIIGELDFTAIGAYQWGSADAADGAAGTVTLAAGHSFAATSGRVRLWDRTNGAEIATVAYTRDGDVLTVGADAGDVETALGLGDDVDLWDVRGAFRVGDATQDIRLLPGAIWRPVAGGVFWAETAMIMAAGRLGPAGVCLLQLFGENPAYTVDDDHWLVGWRQDTGVDRLGGGGYEGGEYSHMSERQGNTYAHHPDPAVQPAEWVMASIRLPTATTAALLSGVAYPRWGGAGSAQLWVTTTAPNYVTASVRPGAMMHRMVISL